MRLDSDTILEPEVTKWLRRVVGALHLEKLEPNVSSFDSDFLQLLNGFQWSICTPSSPNLSLKDCGFRLHRGSKVYENSRQSLELIPGRDGDSLPVGIVYSTTSENTVLCPGPQTRHSHRTSRTLTSRSLSTLHTVSRRSTVENE